ncbi:MAG TPA: thiamine pyrophosphate-binding protein [Nitrososphaeraceae archaeon]|jgi:indolepyruvate decarboxylase
MSSKSISTVGEYLITRLYNLNVRHVFGIPGDYVLGFYDQLSKSKLKIVTTCDEQSAGFAADAYARICGLGVACVTYCVGGLKIVNPIAQAFAEKSPVIVISGSPGLSERKGNTLLHHKVRDYSTQRDIFDHVTIDSTILTNAEDAPAEIERVLGSAIRFKMPVYIELPRDIVYKTISNPHCYLKSNPKSDPLVLEEALKDAISMLNSSRSPVIVAGVELQRFGLQNLLLKLVSKSNIPVVSTPLSKSVINELHPLYLGVYEGAMGYPIVRKHVESSDCVMLLGTFMTDIDFGNSPTPVDQGKTINITSSKLSIKHHNYENVLMHDFLEKLVDARLVKRSNCQNFEIGIGRNLGKKFHIADQRITVDFLFRRLNQFVSADYIVIADVGDALFGGLDLVIHKGTEFLSPAYYLSMGFAIPGSIGVKLANPKIRPIVLVGDGALQMTGVELSTIARENLNPIIIVLNNHGYRTERTILDGRFNDLYEWQYSKLTELLRKGKSYNVRTNMEFDLTLKKAKLHTKEFVLIVVHLRKLDGSAALKRLTNTLSKSVRQGS